MDKEAISWASLVTVPRRTSGKWVWVPLEVELTPQTCSNEIVEFDLFPASPSVGVRLSDVYVKSVVLTVIMKPEPTDNYDIQVLFADIKVESEGFDTYVGSGSVILVSWTDTGGEVRAAYDSVTFNITESHPYGIHTDKLHVTLDPSCVSSTNLTLSFIAGYYIELLNFSKYVPPQYVYNSSYGLIAQQMYEPEKPFLVLYVPPGRTESDPNQTVFPLMTPTDAALVEDSFRFSVIPLKFKVPSGFPGGFVTIKGVPGVWGFTVGLPSNPTDRPIIYETNVTLYRSPQSAPLLSILARPVHFVTAQLVLGSVADRGYTVYMYVDPQQSPGYEPFRLHGIPILPLKHPEAEAPIYRTMLPIANFTYVFQSDGYVRSRPVLRDNVLYNFMYKTANKYRYGALDASLYVWPDVVLTISFQPRETNYMNGSMWILGTGKITDFTVSAEIVYDDSVFDCHSGPLDFIARGITKQGSIPGWLGKYLNILSRISSLASFASRILSRVSTVVSYLDLILETKSIAEVSGWGTCYGRMQKYTFQASNTGWAPEGFENSITIIVPLGYSPGESGCGKARVAGIQLWTSDGVPAILPAQERWSRVCTWGAGG